MPFDYVNSDEVEDSDEGEDSNEGEDEDEGEDEGEGEGEDLMPHLFKLFQTGQSARLV